MPASTFRCEVLIVAAIGIGLAVGLIGRGELVNLTKPSFRSPWLLWVGILVQVPSSFLDQIALPLILASYALLLSFAAFNSHHVGMPIVFVGMACNFVVIAANGGMPVRLEAVIAAGRVQPEEIQYLRLDNKHHIERPGDRLVFLADIFPVPMPGARQVVSFGDLVMAVGIADVIVHWLRRPPTGPVLAASPQAEAP